MQQPGVGGLTKLTDRITSVSRVGGGGGGGVTSAPYRGRERRRDNSVSCLKESRCNGMG